MKARALNPAFAFSPSGAFSSASRARLSKASTNLTLPGTCAQYITSTAVQISVNKAGRLKYDHQSRSTSKHPAHACLSDVSVWESAQRRQVRGVQHKHSSIAHRTAQHTVQHNELQALGGRRDGMQ